MCCTSTQCDAQETCSTTRCRSLPVGCDFVSCVCSLGLLRYACRLRQDRCSSPGGFSPPCSLHFAILDFRSSGNFQLVQLSHTAPLALLGLLQQSRSVLLQPLERESTHKTGPSALSFENGRVDNGETGVVLTGPTKAVIHHTTFA